CIGWSRSEAERVLRLSGSDFAFEGQGELVVAQTPNGGDRIKAEGAHVILMLGDKLLE
ncbi:MAG: PASTA domain-containing protein, partial [Clostridia bacterium]|nr:PASTA domain-containing protein [Clostridia bacterium]